MSRLIPIRDIAGKIVTFRSSEEVDHVQATLEASLKAVGATPTTQQTPNATQEPQHPQRPSWRMIALAVAVVSIGVLYMTLFTTQRQTPSKVATMPNATVTALPTPHPTVLPGVVDQASPREVTLSPIALYGDYDEDTRIGMAPVGIICTLSGQSPDGKWAYLSCPAPTNNVWAKVGDLELTAEQWDTLVDSRIVSRAVPTAPSFSSPSVPQGTGPSLAFCADRESIWGKTHQCAASQSAADALADGEIGKLNATGESSSLPQSPNTPTPQPEASAFKGSFQPAPECSVFIGYVGEKRSHCQTVYATQTAQAGRP